ncbi:MAG: glycerophosphodiester phosphodiesterase family protein [Thermomicrobiales bacterium]
MKIYAHRGASIEFPENTLAAFQRAIDLGVHGIELDVHLAADGVPVVIHDETVDRTTNGVGAVNTLTVDALHALDAGNGNPVPTLDEVLARVAGKLHVNIEIKTAEAADAALAVIGRHPSLQWAASSFVWEALQHAHEVDPASDTWPTALGGPEKLDALIADAKAQGYAQADHLRERWVEIPTLEDTIEAAVRWGGSAISIWERGFGAAELARVHAAGLEAWVWTVNDADRARELLALGIDALCTDDPALMQRIVAESNAS